MATLSPTLIRQDLYAVRLDHPDGRHYELITKNITEAFNRRADINNNHKRDFPLIPAIVVHPSQSVVEMYVAAGNEIK